MKSMKLKIILLAAIAQQGLAYELTFVAPASPNYAAVAWQGNTNTVTGAFGTNGIPDGTSIQLWNTGITNWDSVEFIGGYGWYPEYTLAPGQGFLIQVPETNVTFTITGQNMPGTEFQYQLLSGKSYFLGHVYPREGWLEMRPATNSCVTNCLTWPGRVSSTNGASADRYDRWTGTNFQFTLRSTDDEGGIDADNPTGQSYGARWRRPGFTSGYQTNGYGDNWIHIGQPIFVTPKVTRTWTMFSNFTCD